MLLRSNSIKEGETLGNEQVLKGFGCNGDNVSPDLSWSDIPSNTKSFALICHDPDAPKENGWYHWLVINIPLNINGIKAGEKFKSPALETLTDFGNAGYGGACPPQGHGIHHYQFTIYALDVEKLNVLPNTPPKTVHDTVKKHAIAQASITPLYSR